MGGHNWLIICRLFHCICLTKVNLFTRVFFFLTWHCRSQMMVTGRQRWLTIGVVVFLATLLFITNSHRLTILDVVDNIGCSWQYTVENIDDVTVDNVYVNLNVSVDVDIDIDDWWLTLISMLMLNAHADFDAHADSSKFFDLHEYLASSISSSEKIHH